MISNRLLTIFELISSEIERIDSIQFQNRFKWPLKSIQFQTFKMSVFDFILKIDFPLNLFDLAIRFWHL